MLPSSRTQISARAPSPSLTCALQRNKPTRTNGCVSKISCTLGDCDCNCNYLNGGAIIERRPLLRRQRRRWWQQKQQQQHYGECDDAVIDLDWNSDSDSNSDSEHDHYRRRIFSAANEPIADATYTAESKSDGAKPVKESGEVDSYAAVGAYSIGRTSASPSVNDNASRFTPATFYGAGSEMANTSIASTEKSGGGGGHRIIYCVHGKPEGCCARVLSESNSSNGSSAVLPSPPITLFEDHCHQSRETKVDRRARTKLIVASVLCLVFMIAEIVGGVLSRSLAIATDAAHLLTDFGSFMISLFALWVGSRPATRNMPFGWYRAEVLGALTSVLMIWVVTGVLLYVAVERVLNQQFEIEAQVMLITSAFGVCVNIVMALTLHQHHHHHNHNHNHAHRHRGKDQENIGGGGGDGGHRREENINVRAAYIHVIGDFIQSFGVLIASIIIYYKPEWKIVDPICTFGFSILVLFTTFAILRDTMIVLMEGIPKGIDFSDVLDTFLSIDGVVKVHNLRIWALSLDKMALAAHLAVHAGVNTSTILKVASRRIHQKFNFFEMTLQIEEFQDEMTNCKQCQDPLN